MAGNKPALCQCLPADPDYSRKRYSDRHHNAGRYYRRGKRDEPLLRPIDTRDAAKENNGL
ncbi:MAG: hypothetical protein GXY48_04650 [Methanomicrobiales archaeon]|nr:hypothetical protein [Methanomicrobiales archaeon]